MDELSCLQVIEAVGEFSKITEGWPQLQVGRWQISIGAAVYGQFAYAHRPHLRGLHFVFVSGPGPVCGFLKGGSAVREGSGQLLNLNIIC
jgi:hypothetical protein